MSDIDVLVSEVGPRDGLQSIDTIMSTNDKKKWIKAEKLVLDHSRHWHWHWLCFYLFCSPLSGRETPREKKGKKNKANANANAWSHLNKVVHLLSIFSPDTSSYSEHIFIKAIISIPSNEK